jgi:hypothetical protein
MLSMFSASVPDSKFANRAVLWKILVFSWDAQRAFTVLNWSASPAHAIRRLNHRFSDELDLIIHLRDDPLAAAYVDSKRRYQRPLF